MPPQEPTDPESDTLPAVAAESLAGQEAASEAGQSRHYLPPPTLWEKITGWRGSFLVLSILFHVLLIAVAAFLVVQVVKGREKMKFTAPPPTSAPKSQEHKVQMAKKKNSMSAPSMSKRITTTSTSANIALPAVQMSSSSSPDLMSSVMSGMGGAGLGAGFGAAGGGSAMPAGGLTAFGFKGKEAGGLKGTLYDLKQFADRKPTGIVMGGGANSGKHMEILGEFLKAWDEKVLERYYKATNPVTTYQVFIPVMQANKAPEAFGVEKEVQPSHWVIHYKGTVRASKSGTFRFAGYADDAIAVKFNGKNAFCQGFPGGIGRLFYEGNPPQKEYDVPTGPWFSVQAGEKYPIEIMISEVPGGGFSAFLMIEDKNPDRPYPKKAGSTSPALPVFAVKKGMPVPPFKPLESFPDKRHPYGLCPEYDPEPIIFPGL